jgi:hypothetical protein
MPHSVSFDVNVIYIVACRAVTRLWHNKQLISVTVIVYTTEEHVTSAVTSRNNRRTAGSGVLYAVHATAT